MGEDQPRPGISVFQATFLVVDQLSGRSGFSEIPRESAPRKAGQFSWAESGRRRTREKIRMRITIKRFSRENRSWSRKANKECRKTLAFLAASALEEDHHHEGKDEIHFLMRGQGVVEFFDGELSFEEGRLFGEPHGDLPVGLGGSVARMEKVARQETQNRNSTEEAVEEFRDRVFFPNGVVAGIVTGIEDIIVCPENTFPSTSSDGTNFGSLGIG